MRFRNMKKFIGQKIHSNKWALQMQTKNLHASLQNEKNPWTVFEKQVLSRSAEEREMIQNVQSYLQKEAKTYTQLFF